MRTFTIICLLLVAVAFGLSLAHALELPGKLRLDEAAYRTVQQIYYPGFTIGGIAEPATPRPAVFSSARGLLSMSSPVQTTRP